MFLHLLIALWGGLWFGQVQHQQVLASYGGGTPTSNPFVTGESLGTIRNNGTGNITGCLGFEFTVGSSNITVTDIGRWIISGNNQTHTLIVGTTGPSNLASVTVNASGATPAAFLYGSITPLTLTASTTYFVASSETSGLDTFYDDNTTLTTTADGTIQGSAYHTNAGCAAGTPGINTAGLHSYIPVSFRYHL